MTKSSAKAPRSKGSTRRPSALARPRQRGVEPQHLGQIPILPAGTPRARISRRDERPRPAAHVLQRELLNDFAPAAVLINRRYEILSVQGPVVDYLEFPPGELTRDLLTMARPGMRRAIRSACQRAMVGHRHGDSVTARVKRQGAYVPCLVTARFATGATDPDGYLLVTFRDGTVCPPARATQRPPAAPRFVDESLVRQLENDLKAALDEQRDTLDELKTATEESKTSHAEVMSMDEELRSTREELETSKEELQSLNEELRTLKSQLQATLQELDTANNDMLNLLASADLATVFLDTDFRIKRFTPPAARLLNLPSTDIGRPFRDVTPRIVDATLLGDCQRVLETLVPLETVVRADDTNAYQRRVLPYRTADHRIDGVVIAWVEITQQLAAEAKSRHLTAILQDSNDAVALLDLRGRIIGWNRGAENLYGWTEAEARTMHVEDLAPQSQRAAASDLVSTIGLGERASESVAVQRKTKDGRTRDVWLTMTLLRDGSGQPEAIVTTERDITEMKRDLVARQTAHLYERVLEHLPVPAVMRKGEHLMVNLATEVMTGYDRKELSTIDAWCAAVHGDRALEFRPHYETIRSPGSAGRPVTLAVTRKDGVARHVDLSLARLDDTHELWVLLDTTERDQADQALRRSEDYLRSILDTAVDAVITIDNQGTIETFNPAAERMFGYAATEAIARNVSFLMPQPYSDEHSGHIARYLQTGEARIIGRGRDVTGLRKNGTTFPLHIAVSQIDHLGCFTGILRDLSDQRQLEWRLAESQVHERRQLARELHDGLGGHMTGVGLLAQALQTKLADAEPALAQNAADLVLGITDAHKQLRAAVRQLMPVDAIPEGLMEALNTLANHCEAASGIACRFECEPPVHCEDAATALHLYRIAQEAVHNAQRHSQAAEIRISLRQVGKGLEISITDDGIGLERVKGSPTGIGLISMRQRARLLGGDCSVRSPKGRGTAITCLIPWPSRRAWHMGTETTLPSGQDAND